jgi:hypothetical protein
MSTAAIASAVSTKAAASAPTITPAADPADDGSLVDDATIGRAGLFGLLAGSAFMIVLLFGIGMLAGQGAGVAAAVAVVPGVVAGLFFGMCAYLGVAVARSEHGH